MGLEKGTSANLALARQVFNLFQKNELDSFFSLLHPQVRAQPSIGGAPVLTGRDAVQSWWLGTSASTVEARPLDYEARGDCVVVRGYLRHREGRVLCESQMYWLCEFSDGKLVRMESHPSRTAALSAC